MKVESLSGPEQPLADVGPAIRIQTRFESQLMNQHFRGIVIAGVLIAASIVVAAVLISRTIESEAETTRQTIDVAADHAVTRQVEVASQDLARGGQESIEALGDVAGSVLGDVLGRPGTQPATNDRPPPAERSGSLLGDLFGASRKLGRSVDEADETVVRLSDGEETEIGKKVHEVNGVVDGDLRVFTLPVQPPAAKLPDRT